MTQKKKINGFKLFIGGIVLFGTMFMLSPAKTVKVNAESETLTAVEDNNSTYRPTTIINGGFESDPNAQSSIPANASKQYRGIDGGWNSTENKSDHMYEIEWAAMGGQWGIAGNYGGVDNGSTHAVEMNYYNAAALYQDLSTNGGDVILWTLDHAARREGADKQTMEVQIGKPIGTTIQSGGIPTGVNNNINTNIDSTTLVKYDYNKITNPSNATYGYGLQSEYQYLAVNKLSSKNPWYTAKGIYVIPEGQKATRFAFISTCTPGDLGNLLDNVTFSTLIGNLSAEFQSDRSVKVYGYWGDSNQSKKLELKIGDTVQNIDMSHVLHKNFVITISKEMIGSSTSIDVYHQDYESAKRTIEIPYTITFHENGGSGTHKAETITTNTYTLPTSTTFIAPEGKNFDGWSTTAGGTKITTTTIDVDANIDLYAIWHGCGDVEKIDGLAPTCTTDGYKDYYKCTCDKLYEEAACSTLIDDLDAWKVDAEGGKLNATGHTFGEYVYNKDATTSEDGTQTRECSSCHLTETISAPGTKKVSKIDNIPDGETKPIVQFEAEGGLDPDLVAEVKVEVESGVTKEGSILTIDYNTQLARNEKLIGVYDIKLLVNGKEVMVSELGENAVITVKISVPSEVLEKEIRVLHVHDSKDISSIKLGKEAAIGTYIIDDDGYLVTKIDKLSEFAFIEVGEKSSAGAIVGIIIGSIFGLLLLIYILGYFFCYRKGHLDDSGIKVIYIWLPRGEQNKEVKEEIVVETKKENKKPVLTKEEKEKKALENKIKKLSAAAIAYVAPIAIPAVVDGTEVIGIIYNEKSNVYLFGPLDNKLNVGDVVEVEDINGVNRIVSVVMANQNVSSEYIHEPFKDIIRVLYHGYTPIEPEKSAEVILEEKHEEAQSLTEIKEEPVVEATPVEEVTEEPVAEEAPAEEVTEKPVTEEAPVEEVAEEPVVEEAPVEEVAEEPVSEETPVEEVTEEPVAEEAPAEEVTEKPVVEEAPVEEVAEEPVAEETPAEEVTEEPETEEDEGEEETTTESAVADTQVEVTETGLYRITRIKKTKEAKISMLSDEVKDIYSEIYNKLLSLGLRVSSSKTADKFLSKRNTLAQIKLTKTSVVLYLALEPQELENTKYKGKSVADKKAYATTPFKYSVKTDRKCKWALELIDTLKDKNELTEVEYTKVNFKKDYPNLTEEEYIEKGYITKTVEETTEAPKGFVKVEKIK